jgi:phospholipid N-methyltransferase
MATKSKPVRIFAEDDNALEELTRLLRRNRAEVVHEALVEYLVHHREELSQLYDQTQKAIASGDLGALARASAAARESEVDAIMADMPA